MLATFTVVTAGDAGSGSCSGGQCTLRDAIETANATPGADQIEFDPAVGDTITLDPAKGDLVVSDGLAIRGPGAGDLTIRADSGTSEFRLIDVVEDAGDLLIEDLTLAEGRVPSDAGGAVRFASAGTLSIRRSTISGNVAANGAAVYSSGAGTIEVIDSTISGNTALYGAGGALQNVDGNITVTGSLIENNSALNSGGAIFSQYGGDVTIEDSRIENNRVTYPGYNGGGLNSNEGDITITGSTLSGNTSAGDGGGIYNYGGRVTITDSTISGNEASYGGGGLLNEAGSVTVDDSAITNNRALYGDGAGISSVNGSLTLTRSTVSGNLTVNDGGGVSAGTASIEIFNSTISGNTAQQSGGGIASISGPVALTNSTVSGNTATAEGGGLYSVSASLRLSSSTITANRSQASGGGVGLSPDGDGESLTLNQSIVAANVAPTDADFTAPADPAINLNVDFSLIGDAEGTTLTASQVVDGVAQPDARGNLIGGSGSPLLNPMLGALADNGGPTLTHALLASSIAIDAGNLATLPADDSDLDGDNDRSETLPIDQRGAVRVVGNAPDLGAYEVPPPAPVSWDAIDDIVFGTPLGAGQLDATSSVPGSLVYDPVAGTMLNAGAGQVLTAQFTSDDPLAFSAVSLNNTINVLKAQPVLQWDDPIPIPFGTPLGGAQLNATANVTGTFQYDPAAGQVLPVGDEQSLTVTFLPADATNYAEVSASVSIDVTATLDYGDAPATYPVQLSQNGARHLVGSLRFGSQVDADADGVPTDMADGDGSDEDGVATIADVVRGTGSNGSSYLITVSEAGMLDAWIDFSGDGDWDDQGEQIATSTVLQSGTNVVSFVVPSGTSTGTTAARFRLSSVGGMAPVGLADDGEVEDYLVTVLDAADVPDVATQIPNGIALLRADQGSLVVSDGVNDLLRVDASETGWLTLNGGEGDDRLTVDFGGGELTTVGGLRLEGGSGDNVLALVDANSEFDISASGNVSASDFDTIDMSATEANVISIDGAAVTRLSPTSNSVLVIGGEGDRIDFVDPSEWELVDPVIENDKFLRVAHQTITGQSVRMDMADPWQNPIVPSDVNNDQTVSASDALRVINELGRRSHSDRDDGLLDDPLATDPWPSAYFDQNGDGKATALDALRVINELARIGPAGAGEGELVVALEDSPGLAADAAFEQWESPLRPRRDSLRRDESSFLAASDSQPISRRDRWDEFRDREKEADSENLATDQFFLGLGNAAL